MYGLKDPSLFGTHGGAGCLGISLFPRLRENYRTPRLPHLRPRASPLTVPEPPAPAVAIVSAILLWRNVRGRRAGWDL